MKQRKVELQMGLKGGSGSSLRRPKSLERLLLVLGSPGTLCSLWPVERHRAYPSNDIVQSVTHIQW